LVDNSYIEIYLSGIDGARIYWPWRMLPVHEATKRYRNACERFIVDSAFNKPNTTNEEVLDRAFKVNAEFAVLADVYQDKDATVDALIEGQNQYEDHVFDGKIIYPLQAPYTDCYQDLTNHGVDIEYAALGG